MAVAATQISLFEQADRRALTVVLRAALRYAPLLGVLGLVIGIHVPTMHFYFFGDDFLVLGDVNTRPFPEYMRDVVALRDLTPNWRPLTMAVYYAEFHLFGLDALPWRIVNLSVHAATVALLYVLVLSMTKRVFVASAAALIFGVSASAVHTVTYITAFPHVLSEFLLISALFSLHRYVESGERRAAWYWGAFALYIAGFLANEGGVVVGAVLFVYFATSSLLRRRDVLDFTMKMLPFALAAALLVGGLSGCGCQGVEEGFYSTGWHIASEMWVYMARLAYPVGAIQIEPTAIDWVWGSIVAGSAIFFFIRGPHIARFAAVGAVIGLMPYAPGKIWVATRYTYLALPFFAILVAVAAGWVHDHAARLHRPAAHALAAIALAAVGGLYAWQTQAQTQPFLEDTERWQLLVDDLQANYEEVPPGTTIWVVDDEGLWTNAFWQATWMPSVGHALYGDRVTVRALPSDFFEAMRGSLTDPVYLVEYRDGHLRRVDGVTVSHAPD
jgi:hypothetical protein